MPHIVATTSCSNLCTPVPYNFASSAEFVGEFVNWRGVSPGNFRLFYLRGRVLRTPRKPTAWSVSDPPVIVGQEPQFLDKSRQTRRSLLQLWIVREPTRPVGSRHELGPVPSHHPTMRASPTGDSLAPPHRGSRSQCGFTPNREEESVSVTRSGP